MCIKLWYVTTINTVQVEIWTQVEIDTCVYNYNVDSIE